jgi:serine protease Do
MNKEMCPVESKAIAIQQDQGQARRLLTTIFVTLALALSFVLAQATGSHSQERPATFADLAEQISPSVVNITTSTTIAGRTAPEGLVPEGSPFEEFFNDLDRSPSNGPRRSSALGSGFVISDDGYIVTNNHVIEGADEILIEFFPGDEAGVPAELIGTDPNTDIAVLKVDLEDLSFVASATAMVPAAALVTGSWQWATHLAKASLFPPVSFPLVTARCLVLMMTTSRRMLRLTAATPVDRCSTWTAMLLA